MATDFSTMKEPGTNPAPKRQGRRSKLSPAMEPEYIRAGVTLGHITNYSARSLIGVALRELHIEAMFLVSGGAPPVREWHIVTAFPYSPARVAAARACIQGVLLALFPPDPLAEEVVFARVEWSHSMRLAGRATHTWAFGCADPACCAVATSRRPELEQAEKSIEANNWRFEPDRGGWRCPYHTREWNPNE